jgi:TIR domain
MWIVLLDHSGSMGEHFAAPRDGATFRDRRTEHSVKLDAAIESVLIELGRLSPGMSVSLFGFTSSATLLHKGVAGAHDEFAAVLRTLRPDNGTDIAGALEEARVHAAGLSNRPLVVRILLVTDGLSDIGKATLAAQRCAQDGLAVDVILIDPTDDAKNFAAAITDATGGHSEPVYGPDELALATAQAGASLAAQVERANAAVRQMEAEAAEIRDRNIRREAVRFTASYPGSLPPGSWHPLYVFVHRDGLDAELRSRLAELAARLGPMSARADVQANSAIKRGTVLEVQPFIEKVRCRPAMARIEWSEELEEADFQISYAGESGPGDVCTGSVLVSAEGVPLAQVPVSLTVADAPGLASPGFESASAGMISKVFGSYAHEDADIVARLRAAYDALGIHLFVDLLGIEGGQPWRRYLREQIADSDLFQLFWSADAAASPEVENEWRYALEVAQRLPRGTNFIRPVYWREPLPEPPADLAGLHFWYLDPQHVGAKQEARPGGAASGSIRRADVRFPVITLVPDPDGATAELVQDALRTVVPFAENVTGLRYYPPVCYLVDDETVVGLRLVTEPDARRAADSRHRNKPEQESSLPAEDEVIIVRLRKLLTEFHDHANRRSSEPDFEHIQREAGGGFTRNVRLYLAGGQPKVLGRPRDRLARLCDTSFPDYAHTYIDRLLDCVRRDLRTPNTRQLDPAVESYLESRPGSSVARIQRDFLKSRVGRPARDRTPIDRNYTLRLERTCGEALVLIDAKPQAAPESALLRLALPTYGVFQYRGARDGNGTDSWRVPDTAPAILLCANAFGRLTSALRADGQPDGGAQERAAALMVATLVHEHAHAAIATGLDQQGLAATAAGTSLWSAGASLNEALAAWAQRHYYRDDAVLYQECSRYIEAGDYPDWPYRGADTLERLYAVEGLVAIRRLVHMLRETPRIAQREFDALASAP